MWGEEFHEFTINVKEGWTLNLSKKIQIPVKEGFYYGQISGFADAAGFEIRKDKNFISSRPLYVYQNNPHPQTLDHLCVRQDIYSRDECSGYVPRGLRPKMIPHLETLLKHLQKKLNRPVSKYKEYPTGYFARYKRQQYGDCFGGNIMLPYVCEADDYPYTSDCVFLGVVSNQKVTLREIFERQLYSVHSESKEIVGYLTTVGINGTDLERFHPNRFWDKVAVTFPKEDDGSDAIALLGNQDCMDTYRLDRLEGFVDWRDLEWFHERAEKYAEKPRPVYVNRECSRNDMKYSLDIGTYVIEAAPKYENSVSRPTSMSGAQQIDDLIT